MKSDYNITTTNRFTDPRMCKFVMCFHITRIRIYEISKIKKNFEMFNLDLILLAPNFSNVRKNSYLRTRNYVRIYDDRKTTAATSYDRNRNVGTVHGFIRI